MKTLEELIRKYDWVNPDITEINFPNNRRRGKVEIVHFNKELSSNNVIREMVARGYKPANIYELLEFNPDEQYPIIALGSSWRPPQGRRFVPSLWHGAVGRLLNLDCYTEIWDSYYRFAVIKK